MVVLVIIGIVGFIKVSHDIHPTGTPGRPVNVSIPAGASTGKIGDVLAKAGVIHGPLVFELYVKMEGAGPLMPGTYRMATNEPYSSAVYALEKGPPPVIDKLVVPEGFTIHQIAAAVGRLKGAGISAQAFLEAATGGQVRSPYEPAGSNNLEGLLFPATYPVQTGETADDLVQYMVDTFDPYASQLGLSAEGGTGLITAPTRSSPSRRSSNGRPSSKVTAAPYRQCHIQPACQGYPHRRRVDAALRARRPQGTGEHGDPQPLQHPYQQRTAAYPDLQPGHTLARRQP